jgi:hypothetical protein
MCKTFQSFYLSLYALFSCIVVHFSLLLTKFLRQATFIRKTILFGSEFGGLKVQIHDAGPGKGFL